MCCGVGMSTRALRTAFPDAKAVIGLDTSPQMVAMANFLTKHLAIVLPAFEQFKKRFSIGVSLLEEQRGKWKACTGRVFRRIAFKKANAENTKLPDESFDLVTVMYAFHEAPKHGRERIVKEARRLLAPGGILAIIDISSDYQPSPNMLAGEPYVIEYQQNMSKQLRSIKGFLLPEYKTLVPGHVGMWTLRRSPNAV
jgi:ubiquinone/menaquinone biosynthesis C-methylase UbiE